jgi:exopolyphosphatase/guanosine-5'-triphosphate,3'-diphosphate pyrophosphatase
MRRAVIDIGTNSTRLYVADVEKNEQNCILKMLSTTRLGEGILNSPRMLDAPMARTSDQVKEFYRIARENGAEETFVYATAVVREAKNKDAFKKMILDKTGLVLDIIPGTLEGEIAFTGASSGYISPAVIDIGGGSTEVVTKENGVLKALSLKTGGVRLKEQFSSSSGKVDILPVKEFILKNFVPEYKKSTDILSAQTLIGVSGTPTTIASLFMGEKTYCPKKIQGFVMKKTDFDSVLLYLASLTSEERRIYSGDFAPRADIIVFGGCILSAFMEYYNFDSLTASDRDSLEGYMEYKCNKASL